MMSAAGLTFRPAQRDDLPAIVRMLADDPLGALRERLDDPLPASYYTAFDAIQSDPHIELLVACRGDVVLGVFQITFTPHLSYQGGWRASIEGVRVRSDSRSQGIGRQMFEWAIQRARQRGCHVVQLMSDKSRTDAHRFYAGLGFQATHEGMKLFLVKDQDR